MAESQYFEIACDALERATPLSQLEARGTVRIALKAAGFDSRSVNRPQVLAMVLGPLPTELSRRGVDEHEEVCRGIARRIASANPDRETITSGPEAE